MGDGCISGWEEFPCVLGPAGPVWLVFIVCVGRCEGAGDVSMSWVWIERSRVRVGSLVYVVFGWDELSTRDMVGVVRSVCEGGGSMSVYWTTGDSFFWVGRCCDRVRVLEL